MRTDAIGMFWEDKPTGRGEKRERVMPPIPDTGWLPPREFPNLSTARAISIDVETYDPELDDKGPGWARGKGHIVGASVGVQGGKWYFPIRHEVDPHHNLDPGHVLHWLSDTLGNRFQPKVGANLLYDVGWLKQEGVEVAGDLIDVQYAEALLNERSRVDLDTLGLKYLNEGKDSNLLYQWCADFYGGNPTQKQRQHIHKAPPCLVGPYAEMDADLPLRIAPVLYPLLEQENLLNVFYMECGLIRLMMAMRFRGVRVDIEKADSLRGELSRREELVQDKLNNLVGFRVETTKAESIARAFDSMGLAYNRTAKGQPSFTKKFLADMQNPITDAINEMRRLAKLRGTFLESYILNSHVNGRLHGQFHLLRGNDDGTRSGRLSSSTPNLQNIPARDDELAPLIRGLYLPDYGHKGWRKYDYSQIEYRYLVHYAVGPGADDARALYNNDPRTDYHEMTLDMMAPKAGWDITTPALRKKHRRPIKNINFGLIYGMGEPKLSSDLNLTLKEGKTLFKAYHAAVPFARKTMDMCTDEINQCGTITTILGRKSRFDLWEPDGWGNDREESPALPYDLALLKYGRIKRAYAHKGLNRKLQGSAADEMKKAMLLAWEAGIFEETGIPGLTVHDELDFSDPGDKDAAFAELQHIMENAIKLRVPVKVECEVGPDWGHTK